MNIEDAKIILAACRPGTTDDSDPHLAEALALARTNPELREWFAAEQAEHKLMATKLKAAPLPPGLLAQVQAGVAERLQGRPRRSRVPLALAASVALLGLIAALLLQQSSPSAAPGSFAAFRKAMAEQLRTMPQLEFNTDRLTEVREWLATKSFDGSVELPDELQKFPSIGCRTLDWNGHKAALVCFMVEGEVLHVVVMPDTNLPGQPADDKPVYATLDGQHTVTWTRGKHRFLAVTRADESVLRAVL